MQPLDYISQDLDWRESELATFRILLHSPHCSNQQRNVLLRAAWALLYAHYEGYAKFCLDLYFDEVEKLALDCKSLPVRVRAFAMKEKLKDVRKQPNIELLNFIERFETTELNLSPKFPDVDTKSNLWPQTLSALLQDADIDTMIIDKHEQKLRTLVSRRNEIAHGKRNFIDEIGYYLTFENTIREIMYDLAYAIDDRLKRHNNEDVGACPAQVG